MSAPDIGARERALVAEVMNGTQLSFGPMVERLRTVADPIYRDPISDAVVMARRRARVTLPLEIEGSPLLEMLAEKERAAQ